MDAENHGEPWKLIPIENYAKEEGCFEVRASQPLPWVGHDRVAIQDMCEPYHYLDADTWRRIVACVNACSHLSTEELEGLDKNEVALRVW